MPNALLLSFLVAAGGIAPGTYFRLTETMSRDLEAASFVEVRDDGSVRIAKKITRECYASEETGRLEIRGDRVRLVIDSALGDPRSDTCATEPLRPRRGERSGRIVVESQYEFRWCFEKEPACGPGSGAFVDWARPRPRERSESAPSPF